MGFNAETDQYMICGEEKGEKGTPHIQGYVQLKKKAYGSTVKKRWPRAHLELSKGSPEKNVEYCTKEGKSHVHGELLKGQGARSDLEHVKKLIDAGATLIQIREAGYGTYIRNRKSIIADRHLIMPHRDWTTELHIYWGSTGTGKSHKCLKEYPEAYWKPFGKWWDDYDGQETVIIDEFYGWLPFSFFLRLIDQTPLLVPNKGGHAKFRAKRVICTSNVPWTDWWPGIDPAVKSALERRITSVIHFQKLINT